MGRLVITRENNYMGCLCNLTIFLDNKNIGKISNGEELNIHINNGKHKLYLQNKLLIVQKSNTLSFDVYSSSVVKVFVRFTNSLKNSIEITLISNENREIEQISNKYNAIQKLFELKNQNILTEEEYEKQKTILMKGD